MVNLVVNGDFSGGIADGNNPDDWTTSEVSNNAIWVFQNAVHFNRGNSAPTGSISQTVTGVPIGETVNFSFDYTENGSQAFRNIQIQALVVDSDGNVIYDQTITTSGTSVNFDFIAADTEYTISFIDASTGNTNNRDGVIDNVVFDVPFIVCFVSGTLIKTPTGEVPIETLSEGDLVCTYDNGPQPIRWRGSNAVNGTGTLAPVLIREGALGNDRPLMVSPQHKMLLSGYQAELLYGESEVLVTAKHLINDVSIRKAPTKGICYHHLLFDRHEIIFGNGIPSESFHPGPMSMAGLENESRDELLEIFPELGFSTDAHYQCARRSLKAFETHALAAYQ